MKRIKFIDSVPTKAKLYSCLIASAAFKCNFSTRDAIVYLS